MNNQAAAPVAIVGAGWAGLACAVTLARAGRPVILYEAARQAGGRARRLEFAGHAVDNGQHLLIGAYRDTLALLRQVGIDPASALLRQPLHLKSLRSTGQPVELRAPRGLPAPLHLLWALAGARGLARRDRWQAMKLGLALRSGRLQCKTDRSVAELLQETGQPATIREALWDPLCLAILNTPPAQASAAVFLKVLADAFLHRARDADLLFPRCDLGRLLPDPAVAFVERRGGSLRLGQRITGLSVDAGQRVDGVEHGAGREAASQVVLAVPPFAAARLCAPHSALAGLTQRLKQFDYEPICTVYLQYPATVRLPQPMLGLLGGLGQWVFDRAVSGQPGLMAVVISSQGPHLALDNARLAEAIRAELARHFPAWPRPDAIQVVREKRATFACTVASQTLRPANATALSGLWLAADYTDTGYPATLEGAVRSGVQCAHQILAQPA